MHFGAAVRDVLSATYGADLHHAKAHTLLPQPASRRTLRLLAANLELAFGVAIPDEELTRLVTVHDVLQCVRLRRWVRRVEGAAPAAHAPAAAAALTSAADPRQQTFRFTRRSAPEAAAPRGERPSGVTGARRL